MNAQKIEQLLVKRIQPYVQKLDKLQQRQEKQDEQLQSYLERFENLKKQYEALQNGTSAESLDNNDGQINPSELESENIDPTKNVSQTPDFNQVEPQDQTNNQNNEKKNELLKFCVQELKLYINTNQIQTEEQVLEIISNENTETQSLKDSLASFKESKLETDSSNIKSDILEQEKTEFENAKTQNQEINQKMNEVVDELLKSENQEEIKQYLGYLGYQTLQELKDFKVEEVKTVTGFNNIVQDLKAEKKELQEKLREWVELYIQKQNLRNKFIYDLEKQDINESVSQIDSNIQKLSKQIEQIQQQQTIQRKVSEDSQLL